MMHCDELHDLSCLAYRPPGPTTKIGRWHAKNGGASALDDSPSHGGDPFWEHSSEGQEYVHTRLVEVAIRHRCRLGTTIISVSDAIGFDDFKGLIYASFDIEDLAGDGTQRLFLTVQTMTLTNDRQLRCYLTSTAARPPVTLHGRIPVHSLLDEGRQVVLNGWLAAPHLNGSTGHLLQWNAAAEQWQVFLHTGPDKGMWKYFRAWNLFPDKGKVAATTWTYERLVLWYHQWSVEDWKKTISASQWKRKDWVLWWRTEVAKARIQTELMWYRDLKNPNIFENMEEAGGLIDPRFRSNPI
jgi:hypothetical protein